MVVQRKNNNCGKVSARREGVEQDAPHQDTPTPQKVGQVASQEAKDTPGSQRQIEQQSHPKVGPWAAGLEVPESSERWPDDERQHQGLVEIKRKAECGDATNEPLDRRQACGRLCSTVAKNSPFAC